MQYSFLFWIKWFKIPVNSLVKKHNDVKVKKLKAQQTIRKDTQIYNSSQIIRIRNEDIFLPLSRERKGKGSDDKHCKIHSIPYGWKRYKQKND